ncbi:MAG: aminofutalosine synthase MqnE [Candidatus Dadabacteria bacterium]|nr:MAG: aminofutalosine synthase MqnE [Candidatus Dadabacteria bacterium]
MKKGFRLSFAEGLFLLRHPDLLYVGQLANFFREKLHKDITYFNRNLHLNATNVCEANCLFCSFARLEEGMPNAYTMSIKEAVKWVAERYTENMTEIHIVNGNHPSLPFSYYLDLVSTIKEKFPSLHIKAFTAVEIHHFSKKFNMSYEEVLKELIKAGLGSLPGGGAEIFAKRARKKLCKDKASAEEWLKVHETAHKLGMKSNCTMLYGTIERDEEIIDHLIKLRELQDKTGGFQAFVPLAFHNANNRLSALPSPTAFDDLKITAVSRLLLDNIPHIKAYWVMLGVKTAQIAQWFGANDLDGTVVEEKIYHMAGSNSPNKLTLKELVRLIKRANRVPVERDTLYRTIKIWDDRESKSNGHNKHNKGVSYKDLAHNF